MIKLNVLVVLVRNIIIVIDNIIKKRFVIELFFIVKFCIFYFTIVFVSEIKLHKQNVLYNNIL